MEKKISPEEYWERLKEESKGNALSLDEVKTRSQSLYNYLRSITKKVLESKSCCVLMMIPASSRGFMFTKVYETQFSKATGLRVQVCLAGPEDDKSEVDYGGSVPRMKYRLTNFWGYVAGYDMQCIVMIPVSDQNPYLYYVYRNRTFWDLRDQFRVHEWERSTGCPMVEDTEDVADAVASAPPQDRTIDVIDIPFRVGV